MTFEFYLVATVFIFACAHFSYKRGEYEGLTRGAESCIDLLTKEGILEVEIGENGEEYISPVQFEKDEKDTN